MTLPTLRMEDVPRPWRHTATFLAFAFSIIGGALLFLAWVKAESRAEARVTVQETRLEDVAAFKLAALEAATAAAAQAIRESTAPLVIEMREHIARDNQAQRDTDRRLDELEHPRRR